MRLGQGLYSYALCIATPPPNLELIKSSET
jgi:hypothetical protein